MPPSSLEILIDLATDPVDPPVLVVIQYTNPQIASQIVTNRVMSGSGMVILWSQLRGWALLHLLGLSVNLNNFLHLENATTTQENGGKHFSE